MKTRTILTAAALILAITVQAADSNHYQAQPAGNKVRIEGTSTAHDWEMDGTMIGGWVEFDSAVQIDTAQAALKDKKLTIKSMVIIPVRSVKSDAKAMPQVMEGLMQDALKAKDFPKIECYIT